MHTSSNKKSVLVVDDHTEMTRAYKLILEIFGFEVRTAESAQEALSLLESNTFEILITDFNMPMGSGAYLISETKRMGIAFIKIILATSMGEESTEVRAVIKLNPDVTYLEKPFSIQGLKTSLAA